VKGIGDNAMHGYIFFIQLFNYRLELTGKQVLVEYVLVKEIKGVGHPQGSIFKDH